MKNPAQGRRVFGELRYLCLKIYLYEYKGFAGADGVVGVVALVVPDFSRLFDHGRGFRAVRQSLQFRAGRCLRYGYRTPQHFPVDSGRYVRLYVRRAADAHRDAGFRRAVRYAHGAGCALYARFHERADAAGLSRRRGRRESRSGVVAGRPARPVERPAADVYHRRRGHRYRAGRRRAPAGDYGRHGHRGDAAAEVCRHQVLDRHPARRRFRRAVGSGRYRFRTGYGRRCFQRLDVDALFASRSTSPRA